MGADVLIYARDPAFGGALSRLIDLALEVRTFATTSEIEAEDTLAEHTPVLVVESRGSAEDYSFILRAWRLNPESPLVVCSPPDRAEAHLTFGPLEILSDPAAPGDLVRAVRRGLLCVPWAEDIVAAPRGLPRVLPTTMLPVDAVSLLRRDPLTFNLWREAVNPNFFSLASNEDTTDLPRSTCALPRAYLPRTELSRANLTRIGFYSANLRGIRAAFTQLAGADMRRCDLTDARLVGANLRDADLSTAILDGAEFIGCNLEDTLLPENAFETATIRDCHADHDAPLEKIELSA